LAQQRENAARLFGPRPLAAPSSRQILIRSLKEAQVAGWQLQMMMTDECFMRGSLVR
jgi:hypothetical protein